MKKVAALDFGTNSFLCLIVEGDSSGIKKVLSDQVKIVRLGQDINRTKRLHPDALSRAEACISEFKSEIDKFKVDEILAMATSAARDAENKDAFFEICKKHKIPTQIISGADEARITYLGATAETAAVPGTNERKTAGADESNNLVIDIGGGSTELILGNKSQILFAQSINIGCVRLTEQVISKQPVSAQEQDKLLEIIDREIDKAITQIKKSGIDNVIAVAGTPTSLVAAELGKFDANKIDGFIMSVEKLSDWVSKLKNTSTADKIEKYKIDAGRADVIFVGAVILWRLLEKLNIKKLKVSTKGVRYGIAIELLGGGAGEKDTP